MVIFFYGNWCTYPPFNCLVNQHCNGSVVEHTYVQYVAGGLDIETPVCSRKLPRESGYINSPGCGRFGDWRCNLWFATMCKPRKRKNQTTGATAKRHVTCLAKAEAWSFIHSSPAIWAKTIFQGGVETPSISEITHCPAVEFCMWPALGKVFIKEWKLISSRLKSRCFLNIIIYIRTYVLVWVLSLLTPQNRCRVWSPAGNISVSELTLDIEFSLWILFLSCSQKKQLLSKPAYNKT